MLALRQAELILLYIVGTLELTLLLVVISKAKKIVKQYRAELASSETIIKERNDIIDQLIGS